MKKSFERQCYEDAVSNYREGINGLTVTDSEKEEMNIALTELLRVAEAIGKEEAQRPQLTVVS